MPATPVASICGQRLSRRNSGATFARNRNHHQAKASPPDQPASQCGRSTPDDAAFSCLADRTQDVAKGTAMRSRPGDTRPDAGPSKTAESHVGTHWCHSTPAQQCTAPAAAIALSATPRCLHRSESSAEVASDTACGWTRSSPASDRTARVMLGSAARLDNHFDHCNHTEHPSARSGCGNIFYLANPQKKTPANQAFAGVFELAEREGFEPSIELLTLYSLSRGAPSAARASLQFLHPAAVSRGRPRRIPGKRG